MIFLSLINEIYVNNIPYKHLSMESTRHSGFSILINNHKIPVFGDQLNPLFKWDKIVEATQ
jgi:hypothetical protein